MNYKYKKNKKDYILSVSEDIGFMNTYTVDKEKAIDITEDRNCLIARTYNERLKKYVYALFAMDSSISKIKEYPDCNINYKRVALERKIRKMVFIPLLL